MLLARHFLGGISLVAMAAAAGAQPVPEAPVIDDECQLESLRDGGNPDGESAELSLTDTLSPCDGVLEPPAVGDGELTIPPPAAGETPVIPPRALPEQQP